MRGLADRNEEFANIETKGWPIEMRGLADRNEELANVEMKGWLIENSRGKPIEVRGWPI